ncbi:NLPA lipoprotein [Pseudomonas sp. URMO17WK12:I11]|nr:NLPA lipoprotein [Pseudomonas sp. URMO17WK12:I11]
MALLNTVVANSRSVSQVNLAFVIANDALEAGIDTNSALIVEKGRGLYIEFLAARPDNINDPALQKLAKALNSDKDRQFILPRDSRVAISDLSPIPAAALPAPVPPAHRQNYATDTPPSTNTHTRCSH